MNFAVCILAHHNPWIMTASLISLAMQEPCEDFDLHIVYIQGNGDCSDRESYKEYYEIVAKNDQLNVQLTPDDTRIINIIGATRFDACLAWVYEMVFRRSL